MPARSKVIEDEDVKPAQVRRKTGTVGAEVRTKETYMAAKATKAATATFSEAEQERLDAALERAAGPYVRPEKVHITWFAQAHPSPWMKWVVFTPEIARYLLDNHNDNNRPMSGARRAHYKKTILRGEWHLTHQGMAMDTNGEYQDGQHRAQALIDAAEESGNDGLYIVVPFFVGMAPENFLAIDEGGNRNPQDLFARGGESYGAAIASTIRLVIAFQGQSPRRLMRERQTNETIINFFGSDPDQFRTAAKFGVANSRKVKVFPGPLAAAHYLLYRANGVGNRYVDRFLAGLATGVKHGSRVKLDDLDPREVTRVFFQNAKEGRRRVSGVEAVSVIILAWNNVVEGRNPRFVRFSDESPIPRITVLKDTGDDAAIYTAPGALAGEIEEP